MPSDISNVKVGVAKLTYDGVDLGYTKGGVEVNVTTETFTVTIDQFGMTPINDYVIGRRAVATTPLAETTLDNMVAIMPGATKVIDGVDPTVIKVEVTTALGVNLIDVVAELVIHPKALADADKSEDLTFPKTATPGQMTFAYKLDEERVFNTQWNAYPDSTTGLLFIYGDPAAAA